jgi:hypothetical protein
MATKDTAGSSNGSGTSLTTSAIAVAANGNRVLYFGVMIGTTSVSVSSITRDGQSATKISEKNTGSTCRQEVWRIIAPNTGSATASVSLSGSAGEIIVGWYSAYNVPQATPNSTPVISETTSYTYLEADVSATSTDEIVLAFVGWDRGGSTNTTFGGGQASEYNNVATNWRGGALTSEPGVAGTVNINASGAPSSGAPGNLIAFALGHDVAASAPVLSSPGATVTGNTSATITASTDTLSDGTMHFLRRTGGSAASAATIISTGESQATSGSNPQSKSVTLLGGTANQYVDIAQDGTSGDSNVVTVGPLSTATTLSAPTGTATGNTTATVGFTTDRSVSAAFPAYFLTLPAADAAPSDAATLIANGATVSQTTGGTTPTRALTGLTTATAYRTHCCQPGSNVVSSASYTPSTLTYSGTIGPQGGVQGAAHVWSGAAPSTLFSGGIGTKSFSGTGLGASGLTVNSTSGQLQGTYGTPGTYNVAIVGTDQSTAGSEIPQTETSNTFTLTITATGSAPTVATNPSNLTVTDGGTASFTASFNGSPIPSLQWQEFIGGVWTAMSGETGNVLALGTVDLTDNGRLFRLGGTNTAGGPVYTASATLTVTPAAVGTITSDIFAGWGGATPIASTTIQFVTIERVSTGAITLQLTNQVTGTDGRLIVTNAAITPGVEYMLWCRNTAGTIRGGKKYTAT